MYVGALAMLGNVDFVPVEILRTAFRCRLAATPSAGTASKASRPDARESWLNIKA